MNNIEIKLRDNRTNYKPGETMEGRIEWALSRAPQSLEINLIWTTSGRGSTDRSVVATQPVALGDSSRPFAGASGVAAAKGEAPFQIVLPDAPHSFAGTYIALSWTMEVVMSPFKTTASAEFTISPDGQGAIILAKVEKPDDEKKAWWK